MPRAKRSIQAELKIDEFALVWNLHHEQISTSDGWKGLKIHVRRAEGTRRELHLQYPAVVKQKNGWMSTEPARPSIMAAKVEAHIRQAMADGWDPDSRGKPFIYELDELPG